MGYAGVPKPGDEEKTCSLAGVFEAALNVREGNPGVDTGSSIVGCCSDCLPVIAETRETVVGGGWASGQKFSLDA
jgi:hypothetical protein